MDDKPRKTAPGLSLRVLSILAAVFILGLMILGASTTESVPDDTEQTNQ